MSNSVRPHRQQPTRLRRPWDSPGKNTGMGYHFLLQCMKVKSESEVAQSCLTLHDPMDCSLPGSSIHGIFQARVLEWGAIAFSVFCLKQPIISLPTHLATCMLFTPHKFAPHEILSFCLLKGHLPCKSQCHSHFLCEISNLPQLK